MSVEMKWVANTMPKSDDKELSVMSLENVSKARAFHESFPEYSITPLANLKEMAKYLGLGGLFVKDESYRFGITQHGENLVNNGSNLGSIMSRY